MVNKVFYINVCVQSAREYELGLTDPNGRHERGILAVDNSSVSFPRGGDYR